MRQNELCDRIIKWVSGRSRIKLKKGNMKSFYDKKNEVNKSNEIGW